MAQCRWLAVFQGWTRVVILICARERVATPAVTRPCRSLDSSACCPCITSQSAAMGSRSPTFEPGSLMKLLVPSAKQAPARPVTSPAAARSAFGEAQDLLVSCFNEAAASPRNSFVLLCCSSEAHESIEPKDEADTDVSLDDAVDCASTTGGEVTSKSEPPKPDIPRRTFRQGPPQRRLRGSIAESLGKTGPVQKPVPLKIDALKASRQKAMGQASERVVPGVAVWERAVDERRNAVYYWDHLSGKASWQPPPMHEGWWERLYDDKSRVALSCFLNRRSLKMLRLRQSCAQWFSAHGVQHSLGPHAFGCRCHLMMRL